MGHVKLGQDQVKLGRIKSGQVISRQFKLGQVKICKQSGIFAVSPVSAIGDRSEIGRQVWNKQPVFMPF